MANGNTLVMREAGARTRPIEPREKRDRDRSLRGKARRTARKNDRQENQR